MRRFRSALKGADTASERQDDALRALFQAAGHPAHAKHALLDECFSARFITESICGGSLDKDLAPSAIRITL